MSDGSASTSRRGEKTAPLGTWVRPEVKKDVEEEANQQGLTVAEYLRQLVHRHARNRRAETATA
jgi:hypothetical protein